MFQDLNPLDKPTAVAEIVIMLLGAAVLGFAISWLLHKFTTDRLKAENRFLEGKYNTLLKKQEILEKDNRELMTNVSDLRTRKDSLLIELDDLKRDNEFIQAKYKSLIDTSQWTDKIDLLDATIASLKLKNEELKKQMVEEHFTAGRVASLITENEKLKSISRVPDSNESVPTISATNAEVIESNSTNGVDLNDTPAAIPVIDKIEITNEIIEPKKEIETTPIVSNLMIEDTIIEAPLKPIAAIPKQNIDAHSQTLSKEEIKQINERLIANIGASKEQQKNNLSKINGIGPLIEAKLNSIGIYTFEQISRLQEEDIETVTILIEFFPGRIERDNWIEQAKSLI